MNVVKIILPSWIGTKTFMEAEKIETINHRERSIIFYKVVNRHTFTSTEEIITDTGKNTIYYPCDVVLI